MKPPSSLVQRIFFVALVFGTASSTFAATVEKRPVPAHNGLYLLFKPDKFDPNQSYDLLVVLHGAGDTAENFARSWKHLVDSRHNLLLAVPQGTQAVGPGFTWATGHVKYIADVVTDITANFKITPNRFTLVGFSAGGLAGFNCIASGLPNVACFGAIATGLPNRVDATYKQRLKKAAEKIALYYAVGTQDTVFGAQYNTVLATLKEAGFNLKTERPNIGHTVTPEQIRNMMEFFDAVLMKNENVNPTPPAKPPLR